MSLPSAEVAADFRDALQDLTVNSRPEISNLTIIAKENTEHAQAISRELENHIRTTRPEWKLPALYVLDSIVKNVGTPYTVYLSRNLYKTFMEAWSLVDENTRKSMEGLLRTWKQPVPESMDPRPVFAPQVTRDIENTLIKYRTAAVQQAHLTQRPPLQQNVPGRPMPNTPWRNTPTPPQNPSRYPPIDPRVRQSFTPQSFGAQYPLQATPPASFQASLPGYPPRSPSVDLDTIRSDLGRLIATTTADFAGNMSDVSIQQKLKALLDLQTILKTQTLPAEQLRQIRAQIQQLSPSQAPPASHAPSFSSAPPVIPSPVQAAPPSFPPAPNNLNLAQILANATNARPPVQPSPAPANPSLVDLLRRTTSPMQSSGTPVAAPPLFPAPFSTIPPPSIPTPTPVPGAAGAAPSLAQLLKQYSKPAAAPTPPLPSAPPVPLSQFQPQQPAPAPTPVGSANWLLAALKSNNLIPPTGMPPFPSVLGNPPVSSTPMSRIPSGTTTVPNDVVLTTASMKQPRPHLISKLYDAFPNQCVTCGRRFENTAEGKQRKARHMDWHFKVKDPDMAKRGVHRSWYIGEREWIDYTEVDETAPEPNANGAGGSSGTAAAPKKEAKDKYVPVPTDPALVHNPCPICQEKFEPQWLVEANDFVWMDAVAVGGKIYHATCWEEYSKGGGGDQGRPATPDAVLGKRKAEVSPMSSGKKIRAF